MNQRRQFGPATTVAFVVGTVVGTGIYLKPGLVARLAPNPWHCLGLWLGGGLIALCGSLVYARLAEVWPQAGGPFVYLRQVYGDWAAALLLSADVFVARPTAVGALAAGLGHIWELGEIQVVLLAFSTILLLGGVQLLGRRATGHFQVLVTGLSFVPLLVILLLASGSPGGAVESQIPLGPTLWASAYLAVVWAYDGWYNITILAGEVENPGRRVRSSLVGGMLFVTLLYVMLNAALLWKVPYNHLIAKSIPFLDLLPLGVGPVVGLFLKLALSVAMCSTLNGVMACGPRMISAGVGAGLLPAWWGSEPGGRRGSLTFTGLCLVGLLAGAALPLSFSLFDTLSEFTAVIVTLLSALTVSCVLQRVRFPAEVDHLTKAAACVYLAATLVIAVTLFFERPYLALGGACSVLILGSSLWRFRSETTSG